MARNGGPLEKYCNSPGQNEGFIKEDTEENLRRGVERVDLRFENSF